MARAICAQVHATEQALATHDHIVARNMAKKLAEARVALEQVVAYVEANTKGNIKEVFAGSVPYLMLTGYTLAGWALARSVLAVLDGEAPDDAFAASKLATANFYATSLLPRARALADSIVDGGAAVNALAAEAF